MENCNAIATNRCQFHSSILAVTGKEDFQFSEFYNINRALKHNIPAPNIQRFYVVLHSCCLVLYSCCLVLSCVVPCCTCVVSCCLVLLLM